jgi:hypothetical protein
MINISIFLVKFKKVWLFEKQDMHLFVDGGSIYNNKCRLQCELGGTLVCTDAHMILNLGVDKSLASSLPLF